MKRVHVLSGAALAVAATLAVLAVSAGGQGTPSSPTADFTVTVTNPDSRRFAVDNPPRGRHSPGDMGGGRATITGAKSGVFDFLCVQVRRRVLQCEGTSTFSDGVIYRRARIAGDSDTLRIAIVGGTGAYNGAKGTIDSVRQPSQGGREVTRETYDFVE
jgi:hypothetical protein